MKRFRITIQRHLWNDSDYSEYNVYYFNGKSIDTARNYAKRAIKHWNNLKSEYIYYIHNLEEVKGSVN